MRTRSSARIWTRSRAGIQTRRHIISPVAMPARLLVVRRRTSPLDADGPTIIPAAIDGAAVPATIDVVAKARSRVISPRPRLSTVNARPNLWHRWNDRKAARTHLTPALTARRDANHRRFVEVGAHVRTRRSFRTVCTQAFGLARSLSHGLIAQTIVLVTPPPTSVARPTAIACAFAVMLTVVPAAARTSAGAIVIARATTLVAAALLTLTQGLGRTSSGMRGGPVASACCCAPARQRAPITPLDKGHRAKLIGVSSSLHATVSV